MKVLHIGFSDGGGAGLGMMNQHQALLKAGIDSKVLVAKKVSSLDSVYEMKPNHSIWSSNKYIYLLEKIARRLGICLTEYDKIHHQIYKIRRKHFAQFSSPITQYDVSEHPLVQEADVINLHYIADFIDWDTFFSKVKKPIVWTMRDENPGLGGFHYNETKQAYNRYYGEIEEKLLMIKRQSITQCNSLQIVSLSKSMQEFCHQVDFLACRPNTIIYNAISSETYQFLDRREARKKLNVQENDIILSFVSCELAEERKGLTLLLEALDILHDERIKLLCVGNSAIEIKHKNVILLGSIADSRQLSAVYSASDAFVTASSQESFGKTVVEALYCGTPVISMPVGIASEIIDETNGVLCSNRTPQEIAKGIQKVCAKSYDSDAIRDAAIYKFAPEKVAQKYIDLYSSMLQ